MIRLTITRETLTDGSHVYNGILCSVNRRLNTVALAESIRFVSEKDARIFADGWLNLFLHRTGTQAEVKFNY